MNFLNYLKEIRQKGKRSFTVQEIISDFNISKSAAFSAIHRAKERGDVISPIKGLYVIVPPEDQLYGSIPAPEIVPLIMEHLEADYYVSLLSAAAHHGASHQKPGSFQVISDKRIKNRLELGSINIDFIYKKNIKGLPTTNIPVNTGYLKVATPELTALDLLTYPVRSGGLNHIATVLSELIEAIDPDALIQLAQVLQQKACLQRLGYILEHIDPMDTEKAKIIIKKLEKYLLTIPTTFVALAPEISKTHAPRSKKWMIIENTDIESDV